MPLSLSNEELGSLSATLYIDKSNMSDLQIPCHENKLEHTLDYSIQVLLWKSAKTLKPPLSLEPERGQSLYAK